MIKSTDVDHHHDILSMYVGRPIITTHRHAVLRQSTACSAMPPHRRGFTSWSFGASVCLCSRSQHTCPPRRSRFHDWRKQLCGQYCQPLPPTRGIVAKSIGCHNYFHCRGMLLTSTRSSTNKPPTVRETKPRRWAGSSAVPAALHCCNY